LDLAPRWGVIMPISPKPAINRAFFADVEQLLRCPDAEVADRITSITERALAIITRRMTDLHIYRIYTPHRPVTDAEYLYGHLAARYLSQITLFPHIVNASGYFTLDSLPQENSQNADTPP
jgi:hypothetical protein